MSTSGVLTRALGRAATAARRRSRIGMAVALAVTAGTAGAVTMADSAAAAVPVFPDNIVIFPDRDFISIDGFDDYVGQTATVTVTRNGQVTGSARGTLLGGSPSIEINHPGGYCWGNYAGAPNVTPDIQPGDKVEVSVGGSALADATTLSGAVAPINGAVDAITRNGSTLTITGHLGPDVNPVQIEQRIIAPDLRATQIQRRDVRALPGDVVLDARGQYSSGMQLTPTPDGGQDFVATYLFDSATTAGIAEAGDARLMSWQVEDADANRQGLTIEEFGQVGGPGFGGCPNGPLASGPPAPSNITFTESSSNGRSVTLHWTPATAVPGTPAVTGYRVRAVDQTPDANGNQDEIGKRVNDPLATGVTLTGLKSGATYDLEITTVNAAGNETNPPAHALPADLVGPTSITPSPAAGSFAGSVNVTLASEQGADLWYTLGDPGQPVDVLEADGITPTAQAIHYSGAVEIAQSRSLSAVAFDTAGNPSQQFTFEYTITSAQPPSAPTIITPLVAGPGTVTVTWSAPATSDLPVLDYSVRAYTDALATGSPVASKTVAAGPTLATTFTGLTGGSQYWFTVTARSAAGSSLPSGIATATPTAPLTAVVQDKTTTRPAPVNGAGTFTTVTLTSQGSTALDQAAGVTYQWVQDKSVAGANQNTFALTGATTASPTFQLPTFQSGGALTSPAPIYFKLTVSKSGATATATAKVTVAGTGTVTIATARNRTSEFRITGSSSSADVTVSLYYRTSGGTVGFIGNAPLTPAVPPATGATYDVRQKPSAVPAGSTVYAFTSAGAAAGPFTPST